MAPKRKAAKSARRGQLPAPQMIRVEDLYLDPRNPRLAGHGYSVKQQDEILKVLWKERAVNELVDSIATGGYWNHEEMFGGVESGKLVVFEGNRRLAAVKLLLAPEIRTRVGISELPSISSANKKTLEKLPVIECSREDVWQFIGFKHVNGPQDWDSIAKAQYVATVHNDYGESLADIAHSIGDRHDTVRRLYRGLMVLQQAEDTGQFDREDRYNTRFAYSHLWTGLGYSGIQEFLDLDSSGGFKPNPIAKKNLGKLGELCRWLYGSKEEAQRPLIRSQNPDLRTLDEVLRSENGLAALRGGLPLETSLKASRGDERLLREALVLAEQKLKEALGLTPTGYQGDSDLLDKARNINVLAEKIRDEIESYPTSSTSSTGKRSRTRKRRKS